MVTRGFIFILTILMVMTTNGRSAEVRTTNFVVITARADDAEEFARLAEHFRKQKAIEWLGKEMPPWKEPCPLKIVVTREGAKGETNFDFGSRPHTQTMYIEGKRDRLRDSVLPHEITHTVFAHHFRQPVPRWADEGGSVYSEDDLERRRHDKMTVQILNSGRGIALNALFRMKDYPAAQDIPSLYAQGYSVSRFLVESSDRQTFLNFVNHGMFKGWDDAARQYYSFKNVEDLQSKWIESLHGKTRAEGIARTAPPPAAVGDSKLTVFDSSPPARPVFDAPSNRSSRGLSPASDRGDRFNGDLGWSRPKARLAEPEPLGPAPGAENRESRPAPTATASSRPYSPSAVLLPPEPIPSMRRD